MAHDTEKLPSLESTEGEVNLDASDSSLSPEVLGLVDSEYQAALSAASAPARQSLYDEMVRYHEQHDDTSSSHHPSLHSEDDRKLPATTQPSYEGGGAYREHFLRELFHSSATGSNSSARGNRFINKKESAPAESAPTRFGGFAKKLSLRSFSEDNSNNSESHSVIFEDMPSTDMPPLTGQMSFTNNNDALDDLLPKTKKMHRSNYLAEVQGERKRESYFSKTATKPVISTTRAPVSAPSPPRISARLARTSTHEDEAMARRLHERVAGLPRTIASVGATAPAPASVRAVRAPTTAEDNKALAGRLHERITGPTLTAPVSAPAHAPVSALVATASTADEDEALARRLQERMAGPLPKLNPISAPVKGTSTADDEALARSLQEHITGPPPTTTLDDDEALARKLQEEWNDDSQTELVEAPAPATPADEGFASQLAALQMREDEEAAVRRRDSSINVLVDESAEEQMRILAQIQADRERTQLEEALSVSAHESGSYRSDDYLPRRPEPALGREPEYMIEPGPHRRESSAVYSTAVRESVREPLHVSRESSFAKEPPSYGREAPYVRRESSFVREIPGRQNSGSSYHSVSSYRGSSHCSGERLQDAFERQFRQTSSRPAYQPPQQLRTGPVATPLRPYSSQQLSRQPSDWELSQLQALSEYQHQRRDTMTATTGAWQSQSLPSQSDDHRQHRQELVRRGVNETERAIQMGSSHIVECQGCRGRLQAPIHYALVYCPACGVVSPGRPMQTGARLAAMPIGNSGGGGAAGSSSNWAYDY